MSSTTNTNPSFNSRERGNPEFPLHSILTEIGHITEVISGGTPKASDPKNFASPESGIAWLTPADLSGYKKKNISHGKRDLSELGYKSCSAKLVPAGSIVFSSRAPIGYLAIAQKQISTNQGFKNFVLPTSIDSNYAYYYLKSIRDIAESLGTGTTFKEISGSTAKKLPFLLFPLAEQKIIADKLDELLAQVDTLKARLDAIPAILKRFRQAVLAAAVSGKLTEEWREQNSSLTSAKLEDIGQAWHEAYRLNGKIYKPPTLPTVDDTPYTLPLTWQWTQVGHIFDVYVGATPSRKVPEFWVGNINWISSSEVAFCRIRTTKETITESGLANTSTSVHPPGTVMLAMIGQGKTRGQPAILDIYACHNQNTAALRVLEEYCDSQFLYYFLAERYEETRRAGSGNNQQAMNKKIVQTLPFPLPPRQEQTEIVHQVEQLFTYADQAEKLVKSAQARANQLTQSILAKAFRGELTEQWRKDNSHLISDDNSAEALLTRIKAERAAATPVKKARGKKNA